MPAAGKNLPRQTNRQFMIENAVDKMLKRVAIYRVPKNSRVRRLGVGERGSCRSTMTTLTGQTAP